MTERKWTYLPYRLMQSLVLLLILSSTLLHPRFQIAEHWEHGLFFSTLKQKSYEIYLYPLNVKTAFQSLFYAAIALIGYAGCNCCMGADASTTYCWTLLRYGSSWGGLTRKFYWIFFAPWAIASMRNWLQNIWEFYLVVLNTQELLCSKSLISFMVLLMFLGIQFLLASDIICVVMLHRKALRVIDQNNVVWELRERIFHAMLVQSKKDREALGSNDAGAL